MNHFVAKKEESRKEKIQLKPFRNQKWKAVLTQQDEIRWNASSVNQR